MMNNPYARLQEAQVATADPGELVAMLYDGARRFVDRAAAALAAGNYAEESRAVARAQAILAHLASTLNFEAGGEIARNLAALYDYWQWRLAQGLIRKDAAAFAEVSEALADFHATWQEAARKVRAQRAGAQP